ncbi:MAG: iron ABC transporter permease [candidate division NC10 bacterium]|nr:iron ABC transporter permease [candidate division NC10 bacterium]
MRARTEGQGIGISRRAVFLWMGALLLASLFLSVMVGSVPIKPQEAIRALVKGGAGPDDAVATIVRKIRLPRALLAGIVGACLSLAGLGFQAISRNPLADPSILGVSSGASFGLMVAMLLGVAGPMSNPVLTTLFAFAGALLAAALVYAIARVDGRLPMTTLLLSGVIVGLFFTSCVMLATVLLAAAELQGVVFWLMGNLGPASTGSLGVLAVVLGIGVVALLREAPRLNVLALGEEQALQLGVEAERVKRVVFVAASLITGAAISAAGSIGFVGLIVPHAARLLLGPDNRNLVPMSVLLGAAFLILADLGARTVAVATELPVGVITSFCGAPLFVYLLRRRRGAESW